MVQISAAVSIESGVIFSCALSTDATACFEFYSKPSMTNNRTTRSTNAQSNKQSALCRKGLYLLDTWCGAVSPAKRSTSSFFLDTWTSFTQIKHTWYSSRGIVRTEGKPRKFVAPWLIDSTVHACLLHYMRIDPYQSALFVYKGMHALRRASGIDRSFACP